MKKGFFLLIAIALGAFILHGCQSNNSMSAKGSGYPKGHEMNKSQDQKKDDGNPLKGFS